MKFAQLKSKGQSPTAVAAGLGEKKRGEETKSNKKRSRGMGEDRRRGSAGIWGRRGGRARRERSGVQHSVKEEEEEGGVLDRWGRLVAGDNDFFFALLPP